MVKKFVIQIQLPTTNFTKNENGIRRQPKLWNYKLQRRNRIVLGRHTLFKKGHSPKVKQKQFRRIHKQKVVSILK